MSCNPKPLKPVHLSPGGQKGSYLQKGYEKRRDRGYTNTRVAQRRECTLRDITRTNGLACGGSGTKTLTEIVEFHGISWYHRTQKVESTPKRKHSMYIL